MTDDPANARSPSLCPVVFRSTLGELLPTDRTALSHDLGPRLTPVLARLAPSCTHGRVALGWLHGWGDSTVVVTPRTRDGYRIRAPRRPAFIDYEIARLHHLAPW